MHRRIFATLAPGVLTLLLGVVACNSDEQFVGPGTGATPLQMGGTGGGGKPGEDASDRMTGGGKLGDGRDFATFGFNVRAGQGQLEWQQHCLDGVTSTPTCVFGGFSFHGSTVTSYAVVVEDPDHCRTWTGTGEVKLRDPAMAAQYDGTYEFRVDEACDNGEPGHDTDYMSLTIASYHRGAHLTGGNIQLHKEKKSQTVAMEATTP
jgi:hypothetical protein